MCVLFVERLPWRPEYNKVPFSFRGSAPAIVLHNRRLFPIENKHFLSSSPLSGHWIHACICGGHFKNLVKYSLCVLLSRHVLRSKNPRAGAFCFRGGFATKARLLFSILVLIVFRMGLRVKKNAGPCVHRCYAA